MRGKHVNALADARQMAVLTIVWGAVAGVAYLGLVKRAVDLIKAATGWAGPSTSFDSGLLTIDPAQAGQTHSTVYIVAIAALPLAILAIIGLGLVVRVRPTTTVASGLLIPAALLGLVAVALLFLDVVATVKNRDDFLLALGTLVVIAVLAGGGAGARLCLFDQWLDEYLGDRAERRRYLAGAGSVRHRALQCCRPGTAGTHAAARALRRAAGIERRVT